MSRRPQRRVWALRAQERAFPSRLFVCSQRPESSTARMSRQEGAKDAAGVRGVNHEEKVIAYQDADSWDAEIVYADHKWGVVLLSDAKEISRERQEGYREGFFSK